MANPVFQHSKDHHNLLHGDTTAYRLVFIPDTKVNSKMKIRHSGTIFCRTYGIAQHDCRRDSHHSEVVGNKTQKHINRST